MRCYPMETHRGGTTPHPRVRSDVIAKAVDHYRVIDAFQAAAADHVLLAGMAFFSRCALYNNPALITLRGLRRKHLRRCQVCTHARCGNYIVSARMTNV